MEVENTFTLPRTYEPSIYLPIMSNPMLGT